MSHFFLGPEPHRMLLFEDIVMLTYSLISCPSHTIIDYLEVGMAVKASQLLGFTILTIRVEIILFFYSSNVGWHKRHFDYC